MPNISILMPFQRDGGPREKNFEWIKAFYKENFPEAEICIGTSDDRPFNKSRAINRAAQRAEGDILIMGDADIFYDPQIIHDSLALLTKDTWILPYTSINRLSEEASSNVMKLNPKWPIPLDLGMYELEDAPDYSGGINIMWRDHFMEVGGFDERFEGWGGEDDSFFYAMETLCGTHCRLDRTICHLWHPKYRYDSFPSGKNNWELRGQYSDAHGDKEKMYAILAEALGPFHRSAKKREGHDFLGSM